MFEGIKQHPTLLGYRKQYDMLPSRDRFALKLLVCSLFLVLVYFMIWQPASQYKLNAERDLLHKQQLLELVESNRSTLINIAKQNRNSGAQSSLDSQQLVSSVTNLAKKNGLVLKRFEPSGDRKLKVWVDGASFDKMIAWLATLNKKLSVKVEQISVEKDDLPGQVSARLTLSS